MANEKKHYVLNAEAGSYRISGGVGTLIANTALIVSETLRSPTEETVIVPGSAKTQRREEAVAERPPTRRLTTDAAYDPTKAPGAIILSPRFKLIFFAVLILTILAGIAEIAMAAAWPTPTDQQHQVFLAMDFAWKAGFGAIVGLLGGKAS
jgi:hypothetical protein